MHRLFVYHLTVAGQRAQCSCTDDFQPNPTAVVGCVREPSTCVANKQCPSGFQCNNKFCKPICNSDGNCLSNELCNKNVCQEICRKDGDCNSDEICQGVQCVKGCRGDSDCSARESCQDNQCIGNNK
jgi:hypothetical protein